MIPAEGTGSIYRLLRLSAVSRMLFWICKSYLVMSMSACLTIHYVYYVELVPLRISEWIESENVRRHLDFFEMYRDRFPGKEKTPADWREFCLSNQQPMVFNISP